jgi:hypothetical protein
MLVKSKHRCRWRLGRLGQVEVSIFTYKCYGTLSATPEMETMQKANPTLLRHPSRSLPEQGNAFSKLSSYETAMERRLFKALHKLRHLPPGR